MNRVALTTEFPKIQDNQLLHRRFFEQQSSLDPIPAGVDRPNPEPLWKEVAERYQQIIEKDIKLLQCPSTRPDALAPFQTSLKVSNSQYVRRPVMILPRAMNETRMNCVAIEKQNKEAGKLPKIVKVFSLNPSVPVGHFQDHVTVRVVSNGTIVEPAAGQAFKNSTPKQNSKISENVKEKLRNFVDSHLPSLEEGYNKIEKCVTKSNNMDLMIEENEVLKSGSRSEGNPCNQIQSDCEPKEKTAQKDSIPYTEADSTINRHVSEEVNSGNSTKTLKTKKKKRKRIFGPRRARKKSRKTSYDDYTKTEELKRVLGDQHANKNIANNNVQFDCCFFQNSNIICIDDKDDDHEKKNQGERLDNRFRPRQDDEEDTMTPSGLSQAERICNVTMESHKDNASSSLEVMSHFPGNDIRENKILDLKEKLAKQEKELEELKRKRDEVKESCNFSDKDETNLYYGINMENNVMFNRSHQTDVIFCARNEEQNVCKEGMFDHPGQDVNPGKIDDLKEIFHNMIKSFKTFDDTRFYMTKTGIVVDYGDLRSTNEITDKNGFCHVDNRMKLLPGDVPSKDEFLLQLGLLRK